ncbi:MAG: DNA translocase FtsK [Polyangiaceae bacterium]
MAFFIPGIRSLWAQRKAQADDAEAMAPADGPASKPAKGKGKGEGEGEADTVNPPKRTARTYAREAAALVLIASGLYCALALASYEADPMRPHVVGENWVGPVGEVFARFAVGLVGVVAWMVPLELVLVARPLLHDRKIRFSLTRLSGDIVVAVILAGLTHIAFPEVRAFGRMAVGGVIGELFGEIARGLFSTAGSFLIGLTVVGLILVERATFSFIDLAQRIQRFLLQLRDKTGHGMGRVARAWEKARVVDAERREAERRASEPIIASPEQADAIIAAFADDGGGGLPPFRSPRESQPNRRSLPDGADLSPRARRERKRAEIEAAAEDALPSLVEDVAGPPTFPGDEDDVPLADAETPSPTIGAEALEASITPEAPPTKQRFRKQSPAPPPEEPAPVEKDPVAAEPPPPAPEPEAPAPAEPTIVDTSSQAKVTKARRRLVKEKSKFAPPPTDLLEAPRSDRKRHDPEALKETSRLLEKTLLDYKVDGKVQEIHPGPTVTMFEVSPAPGTKVSKVAGLADDLALGLSRKVRIVAPIPGKARIGFEVPNKTRIPVNLRELIESEDFMSMKAPLPCVLGRDIIGRPCFADLAAMPHIIVAGATGAGKSVGLNVMLVSLLYRKTPENLRMLMIDPKVVELAPFDGIPHLLLPVVTDMKQASNALRWTVDEMERRYQLFADAGTKNITTYNRYVKRVAAGEIPPPRGPKTVEAIAPDGTQLEIPAAKDGSDATLPQKIPYIVVVVEEFADLMMTQGKEVEASVARLAQKARAAGIHVILATQRPSVDVITGMIKANFPTRIAFRVAQKVDSRTIIDQQGAEHLLGRGDMLVKLNGTNDVRRVQCPFVSEEEVDRVTEALRAQGEPEYDESILVARDGGDDEDGGADGAESDPFYDQAVQVVAESGKCSTSWIQRKLGVGYNRAAKLVEAMEKNGVIGPANGSKPREILISAH